MSAKPTKTPKAAGPSGMIVPAKPRRGRFPCGSGCKVVLYTEGALATHRALCPEYARRRSAGD